jgi:hypothetical protein
MLAIVICAPQSNLENLPGNSVATRRSTQSSGQGEVGLSSRPDLPKKSLSKGKVPTATLKVSRPSPTPKRRISTPHPPLQAPAPSSVGKAPASISPAPKNSDNPPKDTGRSFLDRYGS